MTIRRVGDRWHGDDLEDLAAYFTVDPPEYGVDRLVAARCTRCSGQVFTLETDESSTSVRRTCAGCDTTVFMLDSEDHWPSQDESQAQYVVECACGGDEFQTAVGFSFYDDTSCSDIRWVSVAVRCTADGLLGYCADWKVGYGPSHHLVDAV